MRCQKCGGIRIARINAKCDDRCGIDIGDAENDGYVPRDMGVGGGDYVMFHWCLDCGQIQGKWPLSPTDVEIEDGPKPKSDT